MKDLKILKIKNDVDLKDLEKYGFDLRASSIQGIGTFDWTDNFVDDNFGQLVADGLTIWDSTRVICNIENFSLLFDLINDGLVEKG